MKTFTFALDAFGVFVELDEATCHVMDADPKRLIGKRLDAFVAQPCAPRFLQMMLDAYRGKKPRPIRIEMILPGRKKIDVEMSLSPVDRNALGAISRVRGRCQPLGEPITCDPVHRTLGRVEEPA